MKLAVSKIRGVSSYGMLCSESELNFKNVEYAAKAAIMSSYCLYGINFYDEALESLERYLMKF